MARVEDAGDQAQLIRAWLAGYATAVEEVRALQRVRGPDPVTEPGRRAPAGSQGSQARRRRRARRR